MDVYAQLRVSRLEAARRLVTVSGMRIPPAPSPYLVRMPSPIGRIEILSDGKAVTSLEVETDGVLPHDHRDEAPHRVLTRARNQLERYFNGGRAAFTVPVLLRGSPFQLAIWDRLRELRHGETISYGALAAAAGLPGAGRAVGAAIRTNPVPLLVPCHRVLTVKGGAAGWSHGAGVDSKKWLLALEGALEH